jgi:hypothetical protein
LIREERENMDWVYLDFAAARVCHFVYGASASELAAARRRMMSHPNYCDADYRRAVELSERHIAMHRADRGRAPTRAHRSQYRQAAGAF